MRQQWLAEVNAELSEPQSIGDQPQVQFTEDQWLGGSIEEWEAGFLN